MKNTQLKYIGRGIYTVPDTRRFTQISTRCIKYWIQGSPQEISQRQAAPNLLEAEFGMVDGILYLSFLDLIEVLVVGKLRKEKVSLQTIRKAHRAMQRAFDASHPFATHRILTDGKTIFTDIAKQEGDKKLLHIMKDQYELRDITLSFLKSVDFDENGYTQKWWPLNKDEHIVIDPKLSFGQPIVKEECVPTLTIAKSIKAENSISKVARWYDLSIEAAKSAFKYETEHTKRVAA